MLLEKVKPAFQKLRFLLLRVVVVLAVQLSLSQSRSVLAYLQVRYYVPVLILKTCVFPHTNSANVLLHASRCSFLLAVFLCHVCCDETKLRLYFRCGTLVAILKDNKDKKKK